MGNGVGIQLSIGWFNSIFNFNFVPLTLEINTGYLKISVPNRFR